ncbi:helix-turn-helix transcriptional regulator [candidate division WOR-3 bacterium]|nr:helix-turn-helix transcriptional regulator [candidate division WOR-3 bacterium]
MNSTSQQRGREELVDGASRRLVELRKRAGMTQQEVADAMGKSRTGRKVVGELERGGLDGACLLTVADYLRAVRAGFGDLKEVLDRYTALPIPVPVRKRAEEAPLPRVSSGGPNLECVQRRAAAFQEKREPCSRTPKQEPDLQVLRLRRRAGYWDLRKVFEHFLHTELTAMGLSPATRFRRLTARYGRKVFTALFRTRRTPEAKRQERLATVRAWAKKWALVEPFPEYLELAVGVVFEDMAAHDELDWMPPADRAFATMSLKPKHRVVTDAQMCHAEWLSAWSRYANAAQAGFERAHKAALAVAESAQCDARMLGRYKQAAMRAGNIARTTLPDTPGRKQSVANWNATAWPTEMDRKLLDRILEAALAVWDAGVPTLPPAPGPKPV